MSGSPVRLDEPLLTVEQAAELLALRSSTVYAFVRSGHMPCLRLGPRAIRFTRPLLEEWAAQQLDRGRHGV